MQICRDCEKKEAALCGGCVETTRASFLEEGAQAERAAVLELFAEKRDEAELTKAMQDWLEFVIDAIRSGQHRR